MNYHSKFLYLNLCASKYEPFRGDPLMTAGELPGEGLGEPSRDNHRIIGAFHAL